MGRGSHSTISTEGALGKLLALPGAQPLGEVTGAGWNSNLGGMRPLAAVKALGAVEGTAQGELLQC